MVNSRYPKITYTQYWKFLKSLGFIIETGGKHFKAINKKHHWILTLATGRNHSMNELIEPYYWSELEKTTNWNHKKIIEKLIDSKILKEKERKNYLK